MNTELKIPLKRTALEATADKGMLAFLNKDISFGGSVLNDKLKERFYNDLHVLLSSGVDIKTSLELFYAEIEKKKHKNFFNNLLDAVVSGKSLSSAMESMKGFSKYECVSIRIGEETGQLPGILKELTGYFAKRIKLKRQMVSVFSYPAFLLTVTFGVLYFMLNNVVPMFAEVFQRFGKELPAFTQSIIRASEVVKAYGLYFLGAVVLTAIILYSQKKEEWYRRISAKIILRIPIFGKLIHKVYLARFCQSMQLLVAARIPLMEALTLVEQMIEFYPMEKALHVIRQDIARGSSLYSGMAKFSLFEKRMVSLIKVSEEVNSLDVMFDRLAKQYNDEVEYRTSIMGSLIEPLMILIIGVIVGVILVAMYQPLFNISNILE